MKRTIPLAKQSKKAQKAYYAEQRGSWHGVDPVTKTVPSGKAFLCVAAYPGLPLDSGETNATARVVSQRWQMLA